MVTFPNCKINLGLHVLEKRGDGFHDLETVFFPLELNDALEIIQKDSPGNVFSLSGLPVNGNQDDNICIKAYDLLKKDFPQLPSMQMHLHKAIPMGTGLGGGSADGAFTLKLLNQKFDLNLSQEKLFEYSLHLGSDCPFFILNKPCFATGRGEMLDRIELDMSAYKFLIVIPGIHINTTWAFSQLNMKKQKENKRKITEVVLQPIETWKTELKNDFEEIIFLKYPEVRLIKEKLYEAGAIYTSMSGSGSAVYGIFIKEKEPLLSFPENYFIKEVKI